MKRIISLLIIIPVLMVLACASSAGMKNTEVPRITTQALNDRLGEAGLNIVDVRLTADWKRSDAMIKGAFRGNPNDVSLWADKIPKTQTIVLYCS